MSILPTIYDSRVDADAIVTHTTAQITRISELHLQSTRLRVQTGVSDRFVSDSVDLITDDWLQVSGVADHRKRDRHGSWDDAGFRRPPERIGEIVLLRCWRAQRIKRRTPLAHRLSEPDRYLFHGSTHTNRIAGLLRRIICNQLAALDSLEEGVMKFSRHARAFRKPLLEL